MQEKQIRPLLAPSCAIHTLLMFINLTYQKDKEWCLWGSKRTGGKETRHGGRKEAKSLQFSTFDRLQSGCLYDGSFSRTSPGIKKAFCVLLFRIQVCVLVWGGLTWLVATHCFSSWSSSVKKEYKKNSSGRKIMKDPQPTYKHIPDVSKSSPRKRRQEFTSAVGRGGCLWVLAQLQPWKR